MPHARAPQRSAAVGEFLTAKVKQRSARVRKGFLASLDGAPATTPPLAAILSTGRGAGPRLKVYLTLVLVGVGGNHMVNLPASTYADLCGLAGPTGTRNINEAFRWLAEHKLVKIDNRPGAPSEVTLLSDLGSGAEYTLPPGQSGRRWGPESYFKVPPSLWTKGYMERLSAAELAMLLVLLNEAMNDLDSEISLSPGGFSLRYQVSWSTARRGLDGLIDKQLVSKEIAVTQRTPADVARRRAAYRIQPDALRANEVLDLVALFGSSVTSPSIVDP